MLASYKALSVREESAKKLLGRMGYNATHVLDPTFMLNAQNWESHMSNRKIKEPYLLAYLPYDIPNKSLIYKSIRRIFNQNGLKNVSFSQKDFMREKLADRTIYFTDPGDFLSLVYHASFVVTTSFHGTAFCINLNKHFLCIYQPDLARLSRAFLTCSH